MTENISLLDTLAIEHAFHEQGIGSYWHFHVAENVTEFSDILCILMIGIASDVHSFCRADKVFYLFEKMLFKSIKLVVNHPGIGVSEIENMFKIL